MPLILPTLAQRSGDTIIGVWVPTIRFGPLDRVFGATPQAAGKDRYTV